MTKLHVQDPTAASPSAMVALGALLPLSYGIKLLWGLPLPFVEPAFVLAAALWLLQRHRFARIASVEWLLLAAFVLSTVLAQRHDQVEFSRWLDAWSHCARLFALLALLALVRGASAEQLVWLGRGLGYGLAGSLVFSVFAAAIGMRLLPNFLGLDLTYLDVEGRFNLRVFGLQVPRLFGFFPEPAPFGAFGVACLVFYRFVVPVHRAPKSLVGQFLAWLVVLVSLSDQALIAAAILLLFSAPGQRRDWSWFTARATICLVVAFGAMYLAWRLSDKGAEFVDFAEQGLDVWGSSGGERVLNTLLALQLATDSAQNLLVGVGPSLFGLFANEWFPVLDSRHQVQVLLPDLLASVGILGLLAAGLAAAFWIARARRLDRAHALAALLLSVLFQADFKMPALAVALGVCMCFRLPVAMRASEFAKRRGSSVALPQAATT